MLLPLFAITFRPEAMLCAAAPSVADAPDGSSNLCRPIALTNREKGSWGGGNSRWGPSAWATCTARSQLVRISISAPITLSVSLGGPTGFAPSAGSTPLLSKIYRTNNLACDS
jgi:hypothetical protein